jgi:hypothetical protein
LTCNDFYFIILYTGNQPELPVQKNNNYVNQRKIRRWKMASSKNLNSGIGIPEQDEQQGIFDETQKKEKSKTRAKKGDNYHVRAGRIGGQTTKERHLNSDFYREIGAKGGSTTMALHGEEYQERRKKGGVTTRERYGEQYYHEIAAKAARAKQENTQGRNEAIKVLLSEGYKIPTIIKMTLADLQADPHLQKHLAQGPIADYIRERPDTDNDFLFVSQSGKPLSLANTYTVMSRHKPD